MQLKSKRLRVMAGPNGSGKSTVLKEVAERFKTGPFINADDIERQLKDQKKLDTSSLYELEITEAEFNHFFRSKGATWIEKARSEQKPISIQWKNGHLAVTDIPSPYDAALAADLIRTILLHREQTFTFETVMSHRSKISFLEESKANGFKNYLYFICTNDPQINISRIRQRVKLGGHSVPENKVIKRYYESLELLHEILPLCHRAFLFDNSSQNKIIEPVAEIDQDRSLTLKGDSTWWIQEYVVSRLYQ